MALKIFPSGYFVFCKVIALYSFIQSKIPLTDHGLFVTDSIYLFCFKQIYRVQMLEIIGVYPLMQNGNLNTRNQQGQ